jgi:hypothetical protein
VRTRTSQPYGWNSESHGNTTRYRFARHEYDYYPQSWTASDGRTFEEGYYDEDGKYYSNVIAIGGTTMLKCAYCGNHMLYTWKEGALPNCEKCGAQFQIDVTDHVEPSVGGSAASPAETAVGQRRRHGAAGLAALFVVLIAMIGGGRSCGRREADMRSSAVSTKNSAFIREIGRTCYLDGEDWYDSKTKCWFWFNDEEAPAQWQYWYEGISSDYGDYGWMEYDADEDAWYIEATDGNWVHLPTTYDTSGLWHMENEHENPY